MCRVCFSSYIVSALANSVTLTNQTMLMKNTAVLLQQQQPNTLFIVNFVTFVIHTFFQQNLFSYFIVFSVRFHWDNFTNARVNIVWPAAATGCYWCGRCRCCFPFALTQRHSILCKWRMDNTGTRLCVHRCTFFPGCRCAVQFVCSVKRKDNTNAQIPCFVLHIHSPFFSIFSLWCRKNYMQQRNCKWNFIKNYADMLSGWRKKKREK